jgi:hypothetical protein
MWLEMVQKSKYLLDIGHYTNEEKSPLQDELSDLEVHGRQGF